MIAFDILHWCELNSGDQATWALAILAFLALLANAWLLLMTKRSNDQSRVLFELLNRAMVHISNVKAGPAPSNGRIISLEIRNDGNLISKGKLLVAAGSFDRQSLIEMAEERPEPLTIYPKHTTYKVIELADEDRDILTQGNHYYILVRVRYDYGTMREIEYEWIGRWDANRDYPLTENEYERIVTVAERRSTRSSAHNEAGVNNMLVKQPYLKHLKSGADLLTTYEATQAGFCQLALEKKRRAAPFVAEACALKFAASSAKNPIDLLKIKDIHHALLTAAGASDRASNYLKEADKHEVIAGLINNFLNPAGSNFVEELVSRFLHTRNDNLGGSMRNVGGFMAEKKLTRSLIAHLQLAGRPCMYLHSKTKVWSSLPNQDADIELYLKGLSWGYGNSSRTLIYNKSIPVVGNNIDLCLLKCSPDKLSVKSYSDPSLFVALGELKGGIDPAGADEHWKTARSALNRISSAFEKKEYSPHIFFIGAAIEARMSEEIWEMLQTKVIENAANLTDENQISSIAEWLCNL